MGVEPISGVRPNPQGAGITAKQIIQADNRQPQPQSTDSSGIFAAGGQARVNSPDSSGIIMGTDRELMPVVRFNLGSGAPSGSIDALRVLIAEMFPISC